PREEWEAFMNQSAPIAIGAMMLMAILLCLCSEADAFVAAGFGPLVPDAAKLAFLVLGPMLDLKLYLMFTRVFRLRLIRTILVSLIIQVYVLSLAAHFVWTWHSGASASSAAPPSASAPKR